MSAILKFDFQKRKQLHFSEVNYLNYSKRPNFACDNYIFPKTRGNKSKLCIHSTSLKLILNNRFRLLKMLHLLGQMEIPTYKHTPTHPNPSSHTSILPFHNSVHHQRMTQERAKFALHHGKMSTNTCSEIWNYTWACFKWPKNVDKTISNWNTQ